MQSQKEEKKCHLHQLQKKIYRRFWKPNLLKVFEELQMIETYADLKDWFFNLKIPNQVASNTWAMTAWEEALSRPTIGMIYKFWALAGMKLFLKDEINWTSMYDEIQNQPAALLVSTENEPADKKAWKGKSDEFLPFAGF